MLEIRLKRKAVLCISLLMFIILVQSSTPLQASPNISIRMKTHETKSIEFYEDWYESAWVWVDSSGWINSRAEVMSRDLGFGTQNLNLFIASYPEIYQLFDHANWWFSYSDNPFDRNGNIDIQFRTTDSNLAKNYADMIIAYMGSKLVGFSYDYEGTHSWEDWRGSSWEDLTNVRYSAHIDWPWFTEFLNDEVIPRNIGGLAETINVTDSRDISAWAWPSGDPTNPEITFGFGFNFNYDVYYDLSGSYFGSHILNISELIHVTKIQKSPYQGGPLNIHYELPNVTSISHIPSTNTSEVLIRTEYHPPPEDWVYHHYYDVSFEITSGIHSDISVSFNYDFMPWFAESRLETDYILNQYGYEYKGIRLQGLYAKVVDYQSLTNWDPNVVSINFRFRPLRDHLWNSFEVEIAYPDYTNHSTAATALALEIAGLSGISYTYNETRSWNWWDHQISYDGNSYWFESDEFTQTMSSALLNSADVVHSSPVFENQDLSSLTGYYQWSIFRPEISQWVDSIDFEWNPLREEIVSPVKAYSGTQVNSEIDLLTEWGWTAFPFSSNYSRSEFQITVPYTGYNTYPFENNGYGWHSDVWEEYGHDISGINFITHRLEIFSEPINLKFNNETTFTEFGLRFDYTFYDDTVDQVSPGTHIFYIDDSGQDHHDQWYIEQNYIFSGYDEHLRISAWDDNSMWINNWWMDFYYYVWNATITSWEATPRFGSTGLQDVKCRAFFADLPVKDPQFEREIPLVNLWSDTYRGDYNITWDTLTGFADGEWTLVAEATDNAGNMGGSGFITLTVDNYNDTYIIGPTIDVLTVENASVAGDYTIQVNVTDDIGVFAAVLTKDNLGWILEDTNNDSVYEFTWHTLGELEGSIHYFTVTAWDMDGHKVIHDFWLEVDNIPIGNPPTVSILSPGLANETLTGEYTFRAHVADDHGILSVKMQIDNGASLTMNYDETLDEYYYSYNVSTLTNGYHWFYVTAVDVDENQHEITTSVDFTVVGGQEGPIISDPPEWDPSRSELPANLSTYVNEGRLLEYNPESGSLYFKIAVKDDTGIAEVAFTAYTIENFDPSTGEPDESDLNQKFASSMANAGTDGEWTLYTYTWDTTSQADSYYLVRMDVQDIDETANHLLISIVLETDNHEDKEPSLTPGFHLEVLLASLICTVVPLRYLKKRE